MYRQLFCMFSISGVSSDEVGIKCLKACTNLDIIYAYPFIYEAKTISDNYITLYFKTSVVVRKSHLEYDLTSLFEEIGGYTGLLLGVSIADFTKIFKFIYERLHGSFKRERVLDAPEI